MEPRRGGASVEVVGQAELSLSKQGVMNLQGVSELMGPTTSLDKVVRPEISGDIFFLLFGENVGYSRSGEENFG